MTDKGDGHMHQYKNISELSRQYGIVAVRDEVDAFFSQCEFELLGMGRWRQTDVSELNNFLLSHFQLTFIVSGRVEVTWEDQRIPCEKGGVFLYQPFQVYSVACVGTEPTDFVYLNFEVAPYYQRTHFENVVLGRQRNGTFSGEEFRRICLRMVGLHQELTEGGPGCSALVHSAMQQTLIRMIQDRLQGGSENSALFDTATDAVALVNRAVEYTQAHLDQPICVREIAQYAGVSESTLYKVFMRCVEAPPSKFLTQYKMRHAEKMILEKYTLEEIAQSLGYSSGFHLSRVFKATLGKTPAQIKKRLGK